ncbi:MAG: hypothetical protein R3D84_18095 [Paracoccaceae bacterium]
MSGIETLRTAMLAGFHHRHAAAGRAVSESWKVADETGDHVARFGGFTMSAT